MDIVLDLLSAFINSVVSPLFDYFDFEKVIFPFVLVFVIWRFVLKPLFGSSSGGKKKGD